MNIESICKDKILIYKKEYDMKGIWLPIITPFKNDEFDIKSYKRMIDYYISQGISGIIPAGTTGESPALLDYEMELLLHTTLEYVNGRVPVFFGHGGNYTKKVIKGLDRLHHTGVKGILSVCPYYNRPNQAGIVEHFSAISESTDLEILMYNIPYRTGRNMENETILKLAEKENIVALKDASGDFTQSTELLMHKPENFSILSGEDPTLFASLALGGDGGIVASAHLNTSKYMDLYNYFQKNELAKAKGVWDKLYPIIPYLFNEPNPAPLKHILKEMHLIDCGELRLPMTPCTDEYMKILAPFIQQLVR